MLEMVYLKKKGGEASAFDGEAFRNLDAKEERTLMDVAREEVMVELEEMVGEVGWKATKKWLMTRGQ